MSSSHQLIFTWSGLDLWHCHSERRAVPAGFLQRWPGSLRRGAVFSLLLLHWHRTSIWGCVLITWDRLLEATRGPAHQDLPALGCPAVQ